MGREKRGLGDKSYIEKLKIGLGIDFSPFLINRGAVSLLCADTLTSPLGRRQPGDSREEYREMLAPGNVVCTSQVMFHI
ncbi:hypothetical protein CDD79_12655 [Raoultella ornithinolytica]|nr:hypothetical protein CDD79_12655 [Raoultella ornithinolytica]PQH32517.1 hypothetical protein C5T95_06160 [Raoultella ornithinolytica]